MAKKTVKELSIELVKKAEAGTLTVGEALDYVSNTSVPMPESYKSINKQGIHVARAQMSTLRNSIEKLSKLAPEEFPLGLNTPLKDMRDTEIVFLFRRDGSPDLSNRAYNYQIFENILFHNVDKYGISSITEDVGEGIKESMYPRLAGAGNPMGTQRTGLAGERPMEGLLEKEKLDAVYQEALPEIEAKHGANVRRLAEYHRNTFQRPEQLVGLKTTDVIIDGDNVTVKGKNTTKTDHKGRPELTFKANSPMGRLLAEAKNSSTSDLLFDTDIDTFNDAFNDTVGKRLTKYQNVLPLADVKVTLPNGKKEIQQRAVTTPSAIRSIVPHYLNKQLKVNKDVVQGLMGHISADTIDRNYIGVSANTDLPLVLENPENFAQSGFGSGDNAKFFDRSLLSDEQIEQIAGELTEAETQEAKARTAVAVRVQATEARKTQEEVIARAEKMPQEVEAAATVAEGEAQIAQMQSEANIAAKRKSAVGKGQDAIDMIVDMAKNTPKPDPNTIKNIALGTLTTLAAIPGFGKVAKATELGLETLGAIGSTQEGMSTREQLIDMGVDPTLAGAAGTAKGVADFVSTVPPQPVVADPMSSRPIERIAADDPEVAQSLQTTGQMEQPSTPIKIPNPVALEPQMAAQGFVPVPEARANAMRKEETTMKDALSRAKGGEVPSFLYGGIVR